MKNNLEELSKFTKIVVDTANINEINYYKPIGATTNPSLILQAIQTNQYNNYIDEAIKWVKKYNFKQEDKIKYITDYLIVSIGKKILEYIPGHISTEIDARLSYDAKASFIRAKRLIKIYNYLGVSKKRVLIKIAATWQGICSAKLLEKEGIKCNLTLLFSFAQAKACAESSVYLISPFVGRISDWYMFITNKKIFKIEEDPGVISVTKIFNYYKKHGYNTLVMGASFRNINQVLALSGCDYLTISPTLLKQLSSVKGKILKNLFYKGKIKKLNEKKLTESKFLWEHNSNIMAVNKLSEGICNFANDQEKLEKIITKLV
ncbi:MAG: transaldolase [Enterobacterales bacterium]